MKSFARIDHQVVPFSPPFSFHLFYFPQRWFCVYTSLLWHFQHFAVVASPRVGWQRDNRPIISLNPCHLVNPSCLKSGFRLSDRTDSSGLDDFCTLEVSKVVQSIFLSAVEVKIIIYSLHSLHHSADIASQGTLTLLFLPRLYNWL